MASGPITSCRIEMENMKAVTDFFLGSKIIADGDCSHKIRRWLLLIGNDRKGMTNLDSVLKSKDIVLPKKGPYSQGYGLSSSHVWMWELDRKKKQSTRELMLLNCGAREDSWESFG